MSENRRYEIEGRGAAEYVVVRCPQGHRNSAMKSKDDLKVRCDIVCGVPSCSVVWTALVPMSNGFEADK